MPSHNFPKWFLDGIDWQYRKSKWFWEESKKNKGRKKELLYNNAFLILDKIYWVYTIVYWSLRKMASLLEHGLRRRGEMMINIGNKKNM